MASLGTLEMIKKYQQMENIDFTDLTRKMYQIRLVGVLEETTKGKNYRSSLKDAHISKNIVNKVSGENSMYFNVVKLNDKYKKPTGPNKGKKMVKDSNGKRSFVRSESTSKRSRSKSKNKNIEIRNAGPIDTIFNGGNNSESINSSDISKEYLQRHQLKNIGSSSNVSSKTREEFIGKSLEK